MLRLAFSLLLFSALQAQQQAPLPFDKEFTSGNIRIILKDNGPGYFTVGVKTATPASRAIVDVFYAEPGSESKKVGSAEPVYLRYREAVAPVAGGSEFGEAHFEYRDGLLKERIQFVRIILVTDVAKAEVR